MLFDRQQQQPQQQVHQASLWGLAPAAPDRAHSPDGNTSELQAEIQRLQSEIEHLAEENARLAEAVRPSYARISMLRLTSDGC